MELLALIKESDSVELKLTVPESHQRSTVAALGIDPLDAQIRQVFFFDTPDLALDKQGVVVRARRIQGKGDDSVVKLRPVVPAELPDGPAPVGELPRRGRRAARRLRLLGDDEGRSAPDRRARSASRGERPLRKLFSKEQRAFYAAHVEGIALDDLSSSVRSSSSSSGSRRRSSPHRLVAELWLYPDGSRDPRALDALPDDREAFQVAAELRAFLADRGVDLSGEQETKTRKALQYFTKDAEGRDGRRDRPALGVADVRRRLRRRRRAVRRARPERVQESDELYLLSAASDASVKVRDGLMDVKHLQEVNDDGLEQWMPVMKADVPAARGRRPRRCSRRSPCRCRRSRAPSTRSTSSSTSSSSPSPTCAAVEVHKRRERYTVGGCMAELSEIRAAEGADADDRDRVGGPGARDRGRARARARPCAPNVCLARGLKALVGFGACGYAVDRRRHELGQVPRSASGARTARGRTVVDRAEVTRLGEGLDEAGELGDGADRAHRRGDRRHGRRGEARRRRGDRRGRHGRAADRAQQRGVRRRGPGAHGRRGRGHLRRGGGRLAYLAVDVGARARRRLARRLRHGRRQLAVHVRPRRPGRRALQRQRRRRAVHRALRARRRRRRETLAAALDAIARRPLTASTGGRARRRSSGWAARSRTSRPSSTGWRPTTRTWSRAPCSTAAEIDRQIELYRTRDRRRAARDRRAAAEARRGHPRRRLHRPHGARRSSAATRSPSATAACATACSLERFGR